MRVAPYESCFQHSDPELITDSAGAQVVKLSFGAYGERRGSNWSGTPSGSDWTAIGNTTRDGFTGHEHLDAVSLIHMNGRVYDPVVGRFLSADPVIALGSGQGPNPYAYVMNNPLSLVDPSGFTCQPLPDQTDQEAQEEIDRCNAEFEAAGWGPVDGRNSRYCDFLGDCRVLPTDPFGFGSSTATGLPDRGWVTSCEGSAVDCYEFQSGISFSFVTDMTRRPYRESFDFGESDVRDLQTALTRGEAAAAATFAGTAQLARALGATQGQVADALAGGARSLRMLGIAGQAVNAATVVYSSGTDGFWYAVADSAVSGIIFASTSPYVGPLLGMGYMEMGGSRAVVRAGQVAHTEMEGASRTLRAAGWVFMQNRGSLYVRD